MIVGRGMSFVINIITPLILVRYFTVSMYGEYRQVMLILTTASILLPLGMPNSLFYFFPNFPDKKNVFLARTIILISLWGGLFACLLWGFKTQIANYLNNPQFVQYGDYLGITVVMMTLSLFIETALVADKKITLSTKIMTYSRLLRMSIILFCALRGSIPLIVHGLLLFFSLKTVGSIIYFKIAYKISLFNIQLKSCYEQLRYAIPLGIAGVFVLLSEVADKFMISSYLGVEAFAVYAVGCYELPFIAIIFGSIGDVTLPQVVEYIKLEKKKKATELWLFAIEKSMLIGVPMYVFFFTFADLFITTVFTSKYAASIPVFRIALLTVLLESTRYGMITRACARTGFMFAVSLIGLMIMIPMCYFGIRSHGMVGAILAVIGTKIFVVSAELIFSKFLLKIPWRRMLPFVYILKIAAVSIFCAAVTFGAGAYLPEWNKWITLFIIFGIFFLSYVYSTNILKFWTVENLPFPGKMKRFLSHFFPFHRDNSLRSEL